jgi:ribosomal protein S18 acetylase RimI-like enzyme
MMHVVEQDILDLRHFSGAALRPLLEEEAGVWRQRLRWDYRASANLLIDYLDSHILPGYVAREEHRVTGYVFCVYEASKAVIGDVFASSNAGWEKAGASHSGTSKLGRGDDADAARGGPSLADPSPAGPSLASMGEVHEGASQTEAKLIGHAVELLQHSPGVDRIEAQLLLHPHGEHTGVFERWGFRVHPRLYMERALRTRRPIEDTAVPAALELRPWRDTDYAAAGRLISLAYQGHLDGTINDQYRTIAGSLRFLHNIVRFPGCGQFDPAASLVLTYRDRDELGGLLLCSRVSPEAGHVTQICVAPTWRRRGLGRMMLERCVSGLQRRGLGYVSLTVTEANDSALALYKDMGFENRHTFDAMVWQR